MKQRQLRRYSKAEETDNKRWIWILIPTLTYTNINIVSRSSWKAMGEMEQ